MKKIQFILSALVIFFISASFIMSFVWGFAGKLHLIETTADTTLMLAWAAVCLLCGRIWAPICRECYDDMIDEKEMEG